MKKVFFLSFTFLAFMCLPADKLNAYENTLPKIGVLFQPPKGSANGNGIEYKIQLAKMVGVKYIRVAASIPNFDNKKLAQLQKAQKAGLGIILNLNNHMSAQNPSTPPEDIQLYKQQLADILDKIKPELLIIENEECEEKFYTGNAEQYLAQLEAAVDVAHSKGIKVTDGGLTMVEFSLVDHYRQTGRNAEAEDLMKRTMKPFQIKNFVAGTMQPKRQRVINNERKIIDGLKSSKVDYVDLHWYNSDQKALEEVVTYLRNATGKPVITTEIGQHDMSPETARQTLTNAYRLGLPYIIWYSGDSTMAYALQESKSQLRSNGEFFKDFMEKIGH